MRKAIDIPGDCATMRVVIGGPVIAFTEPDKMRGAPRSYPAPFRVYLILWEIKGKVFL